MVAKAEDIHPIGRIAAANIAASTGLDAKLVEQAIADEIQLMSSHFTMAFADIQTNYEAELLKLKRSVAGRVAALSQHKGAIALIAAVLIGVGVAIGVLVR